jgi:[ribosomal protein S5]-alanine N-acetyltransferase
LHDIGGLHALASMPLVYRFLFDAVAPDREFIARRVAASVASAAELGFGMWFLENASARYAGCAELRPYPAPGTAELTYLLDPRCWGQGLAVRMAWTAISQGFRSLQMDSVIAGADLPNTASLAVIRRLGMRFHKDVQYPLGPGVEYVLHRDDPGPLPKPVLMPLG